MEISLKYMDNESYKNTYNNCVFGPSFGHYYQLKEDNKHIRKILKARPYKYLVKIEVIPRYNCIKPILKVPDNVLELGNGKYRIDNISESINFITIICLINTHNLNNIKCLWLKNNNFKNY